MAEDDGVLAALEHDLEVAAADRLLGPPAVEHAPLLADELDGLVIHLPRRPVEVDLDARRARLVQNSGRDGHALTGCDGRVRCNGPRFARQSPDSSAIGATEDAAARRPARPGNPCSITIRVPTSRPAERTPRASLGFATTAPPPRRCRPIRSQCWRGPGAAPP